MGRINEAIGKGTGFLYACPAAPPMQPIESGGISKATQAIQRSGLQHHTQCRPAILRLLWLNILPLPKSMTVGAFPWMRRPYQTRMLLIISHPLPGTRRGTDLGRQHFQHHPGCHLQPPGLPYGHIWRHYIMTCTVPNRKCPRCQTECHAVKSADTQTCC